MNFPKVVVGTNTGSHDFANANFSADNQNGRLNIYRDIVQPRRRYLPRPPEPDFDENGRDWRPRDQVEGVDYEVVEEPLRTLVAIFSNWNTVYGVEATD